MVVPMRLRQKRLSAADDQKNIKVNLKPKSAWDMQIIYNPHHRNGIHKYIAKSDTDSETINHSVEL